jgi:threonyl-tRNA synthetase
MLVVGDKEQVQNKVAVRSREKGDEGVSSTSDFLERLAKQIKDYK